MTNEALTSIKTLKITTPPLQGTGATLSSLLSGEPPADATETVSLEADVLACWGVSKIANCVVAPMEATAIIPGFDEIAQYHFGSIRPSLFETPSAGLFSGLGPMVHYFMRVESQPISGGIFLTAPTTTTVSVLDKKYSEVFEQVFLLRNGEQDDDEPRATEFAYWNCLKTVAGAYNLLRAEHPSSATLMKPTAVVENSGGIRLIWKTPDKVVRANFAGRPNLRSYLYYESGQVYEVEPLDARTLAARLGWLA